MFLALCEDVVEGMLDAHTETGAVERMVERLKRWQAFLGRHGPEGLTPAAQRGLFGELWFLRKHLLGVRSHDEAISAWSGPAAASQDFNLPGGVVEVKTTCAVTPHQIAISNVRQLDAGEAPRLILYLLVVDENEAHGTSLPAMVNAIRDNIDGESRDRFDNALQMAGYLDVQRHLYIRPRFQIVRERFFDVQEGFPRLLASDLPTGVEQVRYAVALAACEEFTVSQAAVADWIGGERD